MDTTHCKHGKYVGNMGQDIMCGLCEDGRNTLRKCRDCDVKVWVSRGQKLNHIAGNPKRNAFVKTIREFRHIYPRSFFTYSEYQIFREIHVKGLKDYFSMFIGNFESKDLHTIK